jgi:hypothetical protein
MDQNRLATEIELLDEQFPNRYVFRDINTPCPWLDCSIVSQTGKHYRLKIIIDGYPAQMPTVYILYPQKLFDKQGRDLAEIGVNGSMHLLSPDEENNIQICHYHESEWTGRQLLTHVMIHAKIWIDALEYHQETGQPLDHYLKHVQQ